jgi:alkylation response protein AidB-like acyl-CoA dehydrogenase
MFSVRADSGINPAQEVPMTPDALLPGCGFLLAPCGSVPIHTLEKLTDDQRAFFRTTSEFAQKRVYPNADRLEHKDFDLLRKLLREAGELGLLAIDLPEVFGGLDADKTTSALVAEGMAVNASWSVTFGAQVGIGTLPILYFGTAAQKAKYLPKLATGEWVAAYALSEASSASDALSARTKAVRSPDGKSWILNGQKQWITNGGLADVFIVFAKIDGEQFSAFVVERGTPGFSNGAEEKKMGIRGSSTTALVFEDARIPVENLLGEAGKGHRIAFNILNIGRLKLGVGSVAGVRHVLALAAAYAKERQAFGKPIAEFGLIREKLGRMAALVWAGESMSYRTTGQVDDRVSRSGHPRSSPAHDQDIIAAVEEYAVEASILKVWGSEALFWAADEAVQIYGGYGFVEEYPVERIYRDNRVNRIFEGTNEINRMLVPGTLLRRALKGQFPLLDAAEATRRTIETGELPRAPAGPLGREARLAELTKHLFVEATRAAVEAHGPGLSDQQEVLGALADVAMEAYAIDSAVARARQLVAESGPSPLAEALVRLYAHEAHERAHQRARRAVLGAVRDVEAARPILAGLRTLVDDGPWDPIGDQETVVAAVLEHGRYPFSL